MYDFDTLLQRKNTDCTKWDALKREYGRDDLMPFWVADADFALLPEISEAIRARATKEDSFGYTVADTGYLDSIIYWNRTRHALELTREEIIPVPGVVTALAVAIMALSQDGDKVLINPPVYTPFFHVVYGLKRQLVLSQLDCQDEKYSINFADLEQKLSSGVKIFVLCSPHNPVGRVWTAAELGQVAALCKKYRVILISDEIHYDIVYSGHRHIPILNIETDAIMITAPSKTFNIAGLKSSNYLIKNEIYRKKIRDQLDTLHLYLNLFAYRVTEVAYTKGSQWVDEMNAYLEENAHFAAQYLKENTKVKTAVPDSTYLMWLDFSNYGLPGKEVMRKLVEEAQLALNSGNEYGEDYDQWMRLNIALPRYYLQEGLERLSNAFEK